MTRDDRFWKELKIRKAGEVSSGNILYLQTS